ncbi:MAG: hypothetical protein Q4A15_01805 [Prevotellaceae bacterium]|nr:hypothetical protein [Prevotellaceae bacterium]
MDEEIKDINRFETRVRQLILKYQSQVKSNIDLKDEIDKKNAEISDLKQQLLQCENNLKTLKIAKTIAANKDDINLAKSQLSNMIREVDKCIKIISESE